MFYKPVFSRKSLCDVLMHFDVLDKVSTLLCKKLSLYLKKPCSAGSAVREPETTTVSTDTACRMEADAEHHAELADMVATMTVATSRMTPPNGFRSGPPRATGDSYRKMSLQERGRIARQPTIETKRVSITDADVSRPELQRWYSGLELHIFLN